MVAWNAAGEGLVLQVSTPSWPAAGSKKTPRKSDGNTLGCVKDDDVEVSQHFFSLKLTKDDLVKVLKGLANASVVTDPANKQIVRNGGPADVQKLVKTLGVKSSSKTVTKDTLSSGVTLISKPSDLNVPPWQMVSALLGGVPLRAATWWAQPEIPDDDRIDPGHLLGRIAAQARRGRNRYHGKLWRQGVRPERRIGPELQSRQDRRHDLRHRAMRSSAT